MDCSGLLPCRDKPPSARGSPASGTIAPRLAPFAVFVVLLALEPWLGRQLAGWIDVRWLYGVRSLLAAGLLLHFWPAYGELDSALRRRGMAGAVAVGLGVLGLWLWLDDGVFRLGAAGSGFVPVTADGRLDWPLALSRWAGSALVVPLIEELFWRSLLMRGLQAGDFSRLDPARVGAPALLLSSLAFGLEHGQWLAGVLAGLAYALLYVRSGKLGLAIVAHAVTNAGLGAWVLAHGAWQYW
jgi:CAAX prenyl protease-like protein